VHHPPEQTRWFCCLNPIFTADIDASGENGDMERAVSSARQAQRAASKARPTSVAAGPALNRPVVPLPAEVGSANQA
jgi:hypothetical protein